MSCRERLGCIAGARAIFGWFQLNGYPAQI
jgi:hypothetical protein